MKATERTQLKPKGEMGLAGGVAFTSSKVQNIKCILILIFFLMVICCGICTPSVFGRTMGRLCFLLWDWINHWDLEKDEGLWGCLILSSSGSPRWRREERAPGLGEGGGQAATAHQRSNNTTDDRPRGKPRAASPSASKAAEWQLQQWKVIQTWIFGACWGLFALERALPGKEWN